MKDRSKAGCVQSGNRVLLAVIMIFLLPGTLLAQKGKAWVLLIEPSFMHPPFSLQIPGAQRTVLVPALNRAEGPAYLTRRKVGELAGKREQFLARSRVNASRLLRSLKPKYVRGKREVIDYALLTSDSQLVASAALAPDLSRRFESVFGPDILVVVPNRYELYVFPKLATNVRDYAPMLIEAYKATPYPVSLEVFQPVAEGLRAIGTFEKP